MNEDVSQPVSELAETEVKSHHPDRVKINTDALARLNEWNKLIAQRIPGVKLSRSDLVNFLILNHAVDLSPVEIKELEVKHYDEVKFAQWAVEELKASRERGEVTSLAEILATYRPSVPKVKRPSRSKCKAKEQADPAPLGD